ncbi:MAG TPA: PilZ domain-containing protein [Desulfatiglandales bacterium]|nr:PilZ domain-containing protein [Desulfatiglandales bacterium]
MKNLILLLGVGFGGVILILSLKFIQSLLAYRSRPLPFNGEFAVPAKGVDAANHERRQHTRARIRLPVTIETTEGTITAETRDISVGGAFICCAHPLPLREKFPLALTLPHGGSLALFAEVVWSNTNIPHEQIVNRGMGVRFLLITKADRMILNDLVFDQMGTGDSLRGS